MKMSVLMSVINECIKFDGNSAAGMGYNTAYV